MKQNILIIEDERSIADTISVALEQNNYLTRTASTAGLGLELLEAESFALIILDVGLPDQNGFDVLKTVREKYNIPVIMLTARTDEIDRVLGLELGADDYLGKPFSPRELGARVKAVLRRYTVGGAQAETLPSQGGFQIDAGKKVIFFNEVKLNLSRYEYGILELLLSRPGWVFSRDKIMDLVWDEGEESFDRTVDTHIKNIRAELKKIDPNSDQIETRRGIGYALRETP